MIKQVNFLSNLLQFSLQFSWVAQSCPTLCDPVNCSTPGLPVHHQLPESTQTHVHQIGDAIQPSHPLSSPSLAPNPSQHQSLFQWVKSSHEVAKYWSFSFRISPSKNTQDWSPLEWTGWISLQSKGLLRVFSNTTVQKHQFFGAQLSSQSNLAPPNSIFQLEVAPACIWYRSDCGGFCFGSIWGTRKHAPAPLPLQSAQQASSRHFNPVWPEG